MISHNHSWEEETRRELAQVQAELNEATNHFEEAKAKVERLSREVEAFELALQSHLRRTGRQEVLGKNMRGLLLNQPNHEERLKRIAEQNNGLIKVGSAADILYGYQIIKSKSRMNAYRIIYGLLSNMADEGIFEWTSPAEFRLVGAQTKLPT